MNNTHGRLWLGETRLRQWEWHVECPRYCTNAFAPSEKLNSARRAALRWATAHNVAIDFETISPQKGPCRFRKRAGGRLRKWVQG